MRDLKLEDNRRVLRLRLESEEDIWALASTLEKGDVVFSRSSRELKTSTSSRRKSMVLGVKTEKVEYQPFTTRLRVHGIIESSPKEVDLYGQYHTLSLEPGMEVVIRRERKWGDKDLGRLAKLSRTGRIRVLVAAIDDEDFALASIRGSGVEVLMEDELALPGKQMPDDRERRLDEKLREYSMRIVEAAKELGVGFVVLSGPAHWKRLLSDRIREGMKVDVKLLMEDTSTGGVKGIHEAIRRKTLEKLLKESLVLEELHLMEEINIRAAHNPELLAYTLDGVEKAVELGAAELVVVDSDLVRNPDIDLRRRVLDLMEGAEEKGARVAIIESRIPELRVWIRSFGGILATLRFRIL